MPWPTQQVTRMAGIHEEVEHDDAEGHWPYSFPPQTATNLKDVRGRKSFEASSEFDTYNQVIKTLLMNGTNDALQASHS
jgi:hypothetical protein